MAAGDPKMDLKCVLLGMKSVGKTCLLERCLHGKFNVDTTAVYIVQVIYRLSGLHLEQRDLQLMDNHSRWESG